jgi:hypothetical protein
MEGRFFNRWNLSIEYFDKRNKDLLFDLQLPLSAGATETGSAKSQVLRNIGTISNRSWEINTDVDIFKNKNWKINFATNASLIKNKILELPEQNRKEGIIDGTKKYMEGRDRYDFFLNTFEGVDQMTGQSLYKPDFEKYYVADAQGNPIHGNAEGTDITENITEINGKYYVTNNTYALKEYHGSALPTIFGSFTPTIQYKGLTLSAVFTYALGGQTYDGVYKGLMSAGGTPSNLHEDVMNSWNGVPAGMTETSPDRIKKDGIPELNYKTYSTNNAASSRWLTSGDYLVLKNLTLSYQLPKNWVKKFDLQNVGLSVSCENLFTLTARQGMNPQQTMSGTQSNYLVTPRVFSVGLNVKL